MPEVLDINASADRDEELRGSSGRSSTAVAVHSPPTIHYTMPLPVHVPPEVFLLIFAQVNHTSLLASSLVSRSWRRSALHVLIRNPTLRSGAAVKGFLALLETNPNLCESIDRFNLARVADSLELEDIESLSNIVMPQVRHFTLPRHITQLHSSIDRDTAMESLLSRAHKLITLDSSQFSFGELSYRALDGILELQSLTRVFMATKRDAELLRSFVRSHTSLTKLGIEGFPDTYGDETLLTIAEYSTYLREFSVAHAWNISPNGAVEFLRKRGANLTGLTVRGTPGFFSELTIETLVSIASDNLSVHSPPSSTRHVSLRNLSLCCGSTVYALSAESLGLLASVPHLRILVLQRQIRLDDPLLTLLTGKLSASLTGLDVSGCIELTEESILLSIASVPGLAQLSLSDVPCVTDKTLEALGSSLHNVLRAVDVGLTAITDKGVAALVEKCEKLEWFSCFTVGVDIPLTRSILRKKGIQEGMSLFWNGWELVGEC
ncbi:hypothetical protein HDU93_001577 [Gonapodya sp. JEL0774]|nr:hypothetical protein HDU93_001577 [Gonapodya sp. JEL0774]